MSIQILDCTLRDGGYVNDWRFGRRAILSILDKLEQANIDIIECGFLTRMVCDRECSLFHTISEIASVLPDRRRTSMYVAMIAIGEKELHPRDLAPYDGTSIDGIRLTFHKKEIDQAVEWGRLIMDKGYQVFMQPVGTAFYSDLELLRLVEKINALRPYAFYIVDTLGSMYRNEVSHRFYLIDENMSPEIHLGFHGHNNLQLAFSNAQVLGKIQTKRNLILDSSVNGMGRGAGNLPTELIAQYINKNISTKYDVSMVMDVYDEYICSIRKQYEWGYSVPYHIAASNVCHPSYAAYLISRQTLTMKDIEKIIQSIPEQAKILYDQKLIERLYAQFQSKKIDDTDAVQKISSLVSGKKLLLLAPGGSLLSCAQLISDFIERERPYVISVNFADFRYPIDSCFISSHKRMDIIGRDIRRFGHVQTIVTSNIPSAEGSGFLCVDYDSCTNSDEMVSDNAGLMLLKLLHRCGARTVVLAGFDGFHDRYNGNYYSKEADLPVKAGEIKEKQRRIQNQLRYFSARMALSFLTPSVYKLENGSGHREVSLENR